MKASDLIAIFPTCTKIGPHRPFQFAGHAPRTDYVPSNEELGRTLALLRAEFAGMTKRERNAAEWSAAYGRHRDSGAEPALAAERATAEMRTAPRFRAPDPNARTVRPINPGLYDLEEGLTDDGHAIRRLGDCDGPDVAAHRPGSGEGLGLSLENHQLRPLQGSASGGNGFRRRLHRRNRRRHQPGAIREKPETPGEAPPNVGSNRRDAR